MKIDEQIKRLKIELRKAKEELSQMQFFVDWIQYQIKVLEIKKLCEIPHKVKNDRK